MSVKKLMVEEFESELKELGKMEVGTEAHRNAADTVVKLADRIIEIDKLEAERELKQTELDDDVAFKEQQIKADKQDRLVKNVLTGVNIAGGIAAAVWAFVASMNFEKTGTITTEGGRNALRHLLKFKW